ncbi:glycosyltransferase [Candidatus Leptofilum sp.]|uniref:glycosyltransferase n=1 Tax=Candidatus Leptofilum sp. TaxID=3241576 RepID=UPI003B5AE936
MNILFLSRWYPFPPNNGSKLRVFHLLRALAARHTITLLSFREQQEVVDTNAPEIQALCHEIHTVPWPKFNPTSGTSIAGLFNPKPRSVLDSHSPEMVAKIQQLIAENQFDVIIASQVGTAGYGRYFQNIPALFEEVEMGIYHEQLAQAESFKSKLRYRLTLAKQTNYLSELLQYFNTCTVVSEPEQNLVKTAVPGYQNVEIIPNCMNLEDYNQVRVAKRPNSLIFTGSFTYHVNYQAMEWYVGEVNSLVQARIPDVQLSITGDHVNLPLPPANNVTRTGFVDDIRSWIASSCISLVPIFMGGGTRLKILEAMALRTPVVATSKGAEGLDVEHGKHLLLADTPQAFADAVVSLLRDPALYQQIAENGYQLIAEKYDWPSVTPHFLNLVQRTAEAKKV